MRPRTSIFVTYSTRPFNTIKIFFEKKNSDSHFLFLKVSSSISDKNATSHSNLAVEAYTTISRKNYFKYRTSTDLVNFNYIFWSIFKPPWYDFVFWFQSGRSCRIRSDFRWKFQSDFRWQDVLEMFRYFQRTEFLIMFMFHFENVGFEKTRK